jgi:hypothetical protein
LAAAQVETIMVNGTNLAYTDQGEGSHRAVLPFVGRH